MRKIYTSVDLGSDSIKVLVGEVYNNRLCVLATSTVKSKGIKKGLIVDANEALATIRDAINIFVCLVYVLVHMRKNF